MTMQTGAIIYSILVYKSSIHWMNNDKYTVLISNVHVCVCVCG